MSAGGAESGGRMRAVVFLDGEYGDPGWHRALAGDADLVLAADGGARFLAGIGVTPGAVVGDFDSLDADGVRHLEAAGVELVRHPVRKDLTDGELAVEEALRRGADEVVLAGATGALDHTLGHLAILRRLAARGVAARLVAPDLSVTVLVAPAAAELAAPAGVRVSVVPLDGDATVTLRGLDYPLDRGVLPADACLGIGNLVSASAGAVVDVHAGTVAVLVEADEAFSRRANSTAGR
jgi:thiamine pyrophosphokinase